MEFDPVTLLFTNVVVLFGAAVTAFLTWRRKHRQVGLQEWAVALATIGIGTLMLALFGAVPPIGLGVLAASLVVGGFLVAWESVRLFNGRAPQTLRVGLLSVAFCVLFSAAWTLGADFRLRAMLSSLAIMACAIMTGREALLGRRSEPLSGQISTAFFFAVIAIDMLIRAWNAGLTPSSVTAAAFVDDLLHGYTMFALTVSIACLAIGGLPVMAHERLLNRVEALAATDELTQLPNRRSFLELGGRLARRIKASGTPACLFGLDLDHFRRINERFGHDGGDRALAAFARVLRNQVRPTDLIGRCGGEEFSVLLADTDLVQAREIAERVRAGVAALSIDMNGQPMAFTVSVGIAALAGEDLHDAMKRADEALYRAKHEGRNRVVVADEAAMENA
jgi:diguanylate cyclase (GGDEF)-like protein